MTHNKQFLVIGNMNAITYKEVFKLIKENKLWLGITNPKVFRTPSGGTQAFSNTCWFTNLSHNVKRKPLVLTQVYDPKKYPKYDNYEAINVDKVKDIPMDYMGPMGVPITFLEHYNPVQFEIVKFRKGDDEKDLAVSGKTPYFRVVIQRVPNEEPELVQFEILGATQRGCHDLVPDTRKYDDYWEVRPDGSKTGSSGSKTNENANLEGNDGRKNHFINAEGHVIQSVYQRIFIQRVPNEEPEPVQFEILGQMATTTKDENNFGYPFIKGKRAYARIVIQRVPNNPEQPEREAEKAKLSETTPEQA